MASPQTVPEFLAGFARHERAALSRAITLVESSHPAHQALAEDLLEALMPKTGCAIRLGITGPPGVGKSSFIEALGLYLLGLGHRVAVLAIDPSSPLRGGSLLGDKARMTKLAREDRAFIRPSPAGRELGGAARRTREALLCCEAFGHDVVLVETVGVGQSETAVADMVDTFLALLLPSGGDEIQGLKKGLLELADLLAINKADGALLAPARQTRDDYARALRTFVRGEAHWLVPCLLVSAKEGAGIREVWESVLAHRAAAEASGSFGRRRERQRERFFWSEIEAGFLAAFRGHPKVQAILADLEADVRADRLPPSVAAKRALMAFAGRGPES